MLQRYVDLDILPGASYAVLEGAELVDWGCIGWADKENRVELRSDHLFRVFSNTKLVTTCAAMLLLEALHIDLDTPVERFLPQLAARRVLRPGATSLEDTVRATNPITIRHLLSHSSGLGYGLLDEGSLIYAAYEARAILSPERTLAQMVDALSNLPLLFEPGTDWEYSIATDVLGRLIEVVSGQPLDDFIRRRVLDPLGMRDTVFTVAARHQDRLTAYYSGADPDDPMAPGLERIDHEPFEGAYLKPMPNLSAGGGLVSTLPDMVRLVRSLNPIEPTLLSSTTLREMMRNQLAAGVNIRFPRTGRLPGKGHGLAGAVTIEPSALDPPASRGECQWGGLAGTHWWISPCTGLSAVLMTQRKMSFWHPFAFDFKRLVYQAMGR